MNNKMIQIIFGLVIIFTSSISITYAAETKDTTKAASADHQLTPEQRKSMADMHQKMADCLKSDKPVADCHKEMLQNCSEKMGNMDCPMMGNMKHNHKRMHQKGMPCKCEECQKR